MKIIFININIIFHYYFLGNKRLLPVFPVDTDAPPIKKIKKEKDESKEEEETTCLESGML